MNCSDEEAMAAWEAKHGPCVCLPDVCLADDGDSLTIRVCELCSHIDPELSCPNTREGTDG